MPQIDVTLDNRARLTAAEWLVWSADYAIDNVAWVDPTDLSIYLDVDMLSRYPIALDEAKRRGLLVSIDDWAISWANVQPWTIVPIRKIVRTQSVFDGDILASVGTPAQLLDLFEQYTEDDEHWKSWGYERPEEDIELLTHIMNVQRYARVIDQIKTDCYHIAVRLAMETIVTRYVIT